MVIGVQESAIMLVGALAITITLIAAIDAWRGGKKTISALLCSFVLFSGVFVMVDLFGGVLISAVLPTVAYFALGRADQKTAVEPVAA